MKYFGEGLSEKHKELSRIIRKPSMLEQAAQLFLEIHASLHLSRISGTQPNEVDALLSDLTDSEYAVMPSGRDETIAWVLWHIARIEDLTMGILAAKGNQLFNEEWQKRLNVSITDTGNALTDDEIMLLSKNINTAELISYRNAVGERTRKIVRELDSEALKRKVSCEDIARIRQELSLIHILQERLLKNYKDNRRSLKMWIDVAEPADYLKIVCYYAGDC